MLLQIQRQRPRLVRVLPPAKNPGQPQTASVLRRALPPLWFPFVKPSKNRALPPSFLEGRKGCAGLTCQHDGFRGWVCRFGDAGQLLLARGHGWSKWFRLFTRRPLAERAILGGPCELIPPRRAVWLNSAAAEACAFPRANAPAPSSAVAPSTPHGPAATSVR